VHDIAIQARENDIVLGTHGRSLYIANLDAVQQLTPQLLTKNLDLFPIKEISLAPAATNRPGRGARPTASIAYFKKTAGEVTIRIKNAKDEVVNTVTEKAVAGLNIFDYDLSAARKTGDGAGALLQPGKYTVELESGSDRSTRPLVVKAPAVPRQVNLDQEMD
jgi:hypothetical protein